MVHYQPGMTLEDVEKQVIEAAIRFFSGNKSAAARSLDIAVRTLDYKLERWNGTVSVDAVLHAEGGVSTEPASELSEESTVPVRKRKKV